MEPRRGPRREASRKEAEEESRNETQEGRLSGWEAREVTEHYGFL